MFSFQDLVKIAKEMKGLIDQTGGAMACPFHPTFLRPNLLSACSKKVRDAILYTLPHASNLLLEGLPSVAFVDANIPRDGAGPFFWLRCTLFPLPFPTQECRDRTILFKHKFLYTWNYTKHLQRYS